MRIGQIFGYDNTEYFHRAKTNNLSFIEVCCNFNKDNAHFIESVETIKKGIAETDIDISSVRRCNHEIMADGKIKIAIQNCNWNNYIVSPREWEVVLGELPILGIKYDASHAYNRRADYLGEMSD